MMAARRGFSLVEVVLALGIVVFVLLTLLALLPMGVQTNRVSAEETRAACLLTLLESDLRNSHPLAGGGRSLRFGLTLPYVYDAASGRVTVNPNLALDTVSSDYSVGLDGDEKILAAGAAARPVYQATVLYTRMPDRAAGAPVEARLVVNWPGLATADPRALTATGKVSGFVESYVSFPAP